MKILKHKVIDHETMHQYKGCIFLNKTMNCNYRDRRFKITEVVGGQVYIIYIDGLSESFTIGKYVFIDEIERGIRIQI